MSKEKNGYIIFVVIMFLALGGLVLSASLMQDTTGARTIHATKTRAMDYAEAEAGIGHAVSWLRKNSQNLVSPFRRDVFYGSFEKAEPTESDNDSDALTIPTMTKLINTTDSAILQNDATLGTAAFPSTINISTNAAFDAAAEFEAADFGGAKVRLTLLDAVPGDSSKDYGPPPNATPETDFYPVYRIDSMTDTNKGAHVYGTVTGDLVHRFDVGIYGENYLEIRQPCDSYRSSEGPYSTLIRRANCPAASNSTAAVHKNEEIYGSLKTNGSIHATPPYGGKTCADFESGCPNKGETCAGEDCGVPLLDEYYAWSTYCPTDQGNITISGTSTLAIAGTDPSQRCWDTVTISTNSKLILTSTNSPYYFKTLTFQNNSNSKLDVQPDPAGKKVELYILTITGNAFNGNQQLNSTGKPSRLTLNYLGTETLTLNGTAAMNMALVSPNAAVVVSGSFEFNGALLALQLTLSGSGGIHYDEDLGGTGPVVDIQYRIKNLVQYYR